METLYINALFSLTLPIKILIPPVLVKGSLLGDGVRVTLDFFGFARRGLARFYEQDWKGDQYLYVEMFVEELYHWPVPGKVKIIRLRRIPRVRGQVQH